MRGGAWSASSRGTFASNAPSTVSGYYDYDATHSLRRPLALVSFLNTTSRAVGSRLAALTGVPLTILDEAVEHRLGSSARAVLSEAGLGAWREVEAIELARALAARPFGIIVLGEGSLSSPRSRRLATASSDLIHLHETLERARERLGPSANLVTLIAEAEGIPGSDEEAIAALFGLRESEYVSAALRFEIAGRSSNTAARALIDRLEEEGILARA